MHRQLLAVCGSSWYLARPKSTDYAQSMRKQERIKTDELAFEEGLRNGQFVQADRKTGSCLVRNGQVVISEAGSGRVTKGDWAFLRMNGDDPRPLFVCLVDAEKEDPGGTYLDPRSAMVNNVDRLDLVYQASSVVRWLMSYRFCSSCGSSDLVSKGGGHQKQCAVCRKVAYASPVPAIISLVESPDRDQVLLIRQSRHPPGMFTCVAGFVDLGENVVDAVRREVAEETAVQLDPNQISFMDVDVSKHWPYPNGSLMLACRAVAERLTTPVPFPGEIDVAAWFKIDDLVQAHERSSKMSRLEPVKDRDVFDKNIFLTTPPPGTVAHAMFSRFIQNM